MAMTLNVWYTIISTTLEVRKLLDNALTPKGGETTVIGSVQLPVSPAVRTRLRGELLTKLNELRASLNLVLTEKDVALVIYPLIIHIDELVMRRLSKQEQTQWSLLQKELFDIIDGGEAFFDFATERLSKPDTVEAAIKTCREIDKLESDADRIMRSAMSNLFRDERVEVRELIKLKVIYEQLELISDRCEDVANLIEGIVLENS